MKNCSAFATLIGGFSSPSLSMSSPMHSMTVLIARAIDYLDRSSLEGSDISAFIRLHMISSLLLRAALSRLRRIDINGC